MVLSLAAPAKKDALVLGKRKLSYDELLARSWKLAQRLEGSETEQILLFAENSLGWAVAIYAIWAAKKVAVPLDAQSKPEEVAYVIADSKVRVIFCSRETRAALDAALETTEMESSPTILLIDDLLDEEISVNDPGPILGETESAGPLAAIIYTSGTTGDPKGVMLTFANLEANLKAVQKFGYFAPDERVLLLLPLHHVLPLMGCLLAPLATGGTSYLCPSLARQDVLDTLREGKITMLVGVPRFFELLAASISEKIAGSFLARSLFSFAQKQQNAALSARLFKKVHEGFGGHLRYMVCGGAPLAPDVVRLFGTLGFRLCEGYGMTECAPLITFPDPERIKAGYCGKPLEGSRVEIRQGEIVVKGPQVMRGYYGRPQETAEVLKDGWLHTGDLGEFDDDGFLRITGRKKEILVLPNGKNVNPALSEAMLEKHEEIDEAGVFLDGGVLHALVLLNERKVPREERDLESFAFSVAVRDHNQRVAPYRKISRVSVVREPLPRTRLGKLRRHLLEELAASVGRGEPPRPPRDGIESDLARYLAKVGCAKVTVKSRLGADLGLDSMARLELRAFIRSSFSAPIDEVELDDRLTVEELANLIETRKTGHSSISEVDWAKILDEKSRVRLPSTSALHVLLLIVLRILTSVLLRLKVAGSRELPPGPKLFTPNHQSALDGVFLTSSLRLWDARDVYFLAKEKHMRHPLVRFLADRGRIIVLDESAGLQSSLRAVALVLAAGRSVVVFPEGTRSHDGNPGPFRSSYAIVAHHAKVPIVPVAIQGALSVLPRGKTWPRLGRLVRVTFLPSIDATGDPDETNARVREAILEKLA